MSWGAQAGAAKYVVRISRSADMSNAGFRAFTTNSGTISGLKPGTTYYMQVIVKHSKTNEALSQYSSKVTAKTTSVSSSGYRWSAPAGLKVSGATTSTLDVSWGAQAGAAKYVV
ncbi:hypothetical protein, partial [Aeromicrobium sp. CF3.5]|uniref:fibronectin type III domain-containing protein n=1 Tax=Aeromicrobium sp. CF3.5 TaxID=3373078 RepID=UPI003EE44566